MGYVADELKHALVVLGTHAEELSPAQLHPVRKDRQARFVEPLGAEPWWERLRASVGVQSPEAWRWIASVPLEGRAILFFDELEERAGFAFDSADQVVRTLAEAVGFEFYLTDEARSFLLAFNHHDCLAATGTAAKWLLDLDVERQSPKRD